MKFVIRELHVPVARLPPGFSGMRVAHVSDLHLRRWNRRWQRLRETLVALDADLVAVTGDFCDRPPGWRRAAELTRRIFEPVRPRYGLFGVIGNHDPDEFVRSMAGTHLCFLRDEVVTVSADGGGALNLAGVKQIDVGHGDIVKCLSAADPACPTILLAHYPSVVHFLPPGAVDLLLTGHTHGGQWRFPIVGCLWPQDWIPRPLAIGTHDVNGTLLHVSAGVGIAGPLWCRVNCPAEVSVVRLVSGEMGSEPPSSVERVLRRSPGTADPTRSAAGP